MMVIMLIFNLESILTNIDTVRASEMEYETLYYINPLYKDVVQIQDLQGLPCYATSTLAEPIYLTDDSVAIDNLREAFVERMPSVTIYYEQKGAFEDEQFNEWINEVFEHTGNPAEGDYLRWQCGGASLHTSCLIYPNETYKYTLVFSFLYYTTAEQEEKLDEAIEKLFDEIQIVDVMRDYYKIKSVYDYVCSNITYDYDNLNDSDYKLKYTAYAALIHKSAVCQGYALLLYRIYNELGISTRLIAGTAGGGAHGWNIVKLDGVYYLADSTWDAGKTTYRYFLKGSSSFTDHASYDEYCSSEFLSAYPISSEDYVAPNIVESGYCGEEGHTEDAIYTLYNNGTLVIEGTVGIASGKFRERTDIKTVKIDTGITGIGDYAFSLCTEIESIDISETVTSIGERAFESCYSLKSIDIPESVASIEKYAFVYCSGITNVHLPNNITSIEESVFSNCNSLTNITIPEGVTSIDNGSFYNCSGLENITIPQSVVNIASTAFENCTNLESVYITDLKKWCEITFGATKTNPLYYGADLFLNGEVLSGEIAIPEGTTIIGDYAFEGWEGFTSITVPESVASIGKYAFSKCDQMASISLDEGLRSIGECAFEYCGALTSISIPESVTSIGRGAFYGCTGLTSVDIPGGIVALSTQMFYGCTNLKEVYVPEGVTNIGIMSFYKCSNLVKVTLPKSLTNIGTNAFYQCGRVVLFVQNPYEENYAITNRVSYVAVPDEIVIEQGATKRNYCIGENLDLSGIVLKAVYYGGEKEEYIDSGYQISGFDSTEAGKCVVTIEYMECKATFEVTILASHVYDNELDDNCNACGYNRTVKTIAIKTEPNKTIYCIGENLNTDGLILTLTYSDGTTKEVSNGYTVSGFDSSEAGICAVAVIYNGQTTSYNVTIIKKNDTVTRVYGTDRFTTAFNVADALKTQLNIDKFDSIIIANGLNFADALAGSYLAGVKKAPILMTAGQNVNDLVSYISENLNTGGTVYLLGGTSAVPKNVEDALSGYHVKRLWGATRFETNLAILQEAGVENQDILVCTAYGFADSLSASSTGKPILLVSGELTAEQHAFLSGVQGSNIYIIGGVNAVNVSVETALKSYGTVTRLGGADRFATSVLIAETFFDNPESAVIAYSHNFPDGLSGGPLAMSLSGPLILSIEGNETAATTYLQQHDIISGAVLGGTGILSDSTVVKIFGLESSDSIKVWQ